MLTREEHKMELPKTKYENTRLELARVTESDLMIEDHGHLILSVNLDYGGKRQGWPLIVDDDTQAIRNWMEVCCSDTMDKCKYKYVFVESDHGKIFRLISVSVDPFEWDIEGEKEAIE